MKTNNVSSRLVFSGVLRLVAVVALGACSSTTTPGFSSDSGIDVPSADVTCTGDETACGGFCVDLRASAANCGACGHACSSGQMCVSGQCLSQCPSTQTRCGTQCITLATDRMNCGACGTACPTGQVCSMGACAIACGPMYAQCTDAQADAGVDAGVRRAGPYCTDTRTDERNCGACGTLCPLGQVCESGTCALHCPSTQVECNGRCVTLANDNANCGACGNACTGRARCQDGTCTASACASGTTMCGSTCVDLQYDNANCGTCGTACTAPSFCRMGACTTECRTGSTMCAGRCVDITSDRTNCGACGMACPTGQVCTASHCALVCPMGTVMCGGRCVSTSSDRTNCGACGTTCTASQLCVGGACAPSCAAEQTNCGGVCINTQVDAANCGACGVSCGPGYACGGGFCRPLVGTDVIGCETPSLMCGTTCSDVRNDNRNCGACGTACAADRVCVNGTCSALCIAGQTRCGGVCTDVRGDRLNCGACGTVCAAPLVCGGGHCVTDPSFRVASFGTTGCHIVEHGTVTGDDHGGIAISPSHVFYNSDGLMFGGPNTSGRWSATDLSGGEQINTLDSLTGDLLTENVYLIRNAIGEGPEAATGSGAGTFLATQLQAVDGNTGTPTMSFIRLSTPIVMGSNYGIFAGYGRMLLHTGTGTGVTSQWFGIQLPSGTVTPLAMAPPPTHTFCETDGYWGIAEFVGGEYFAVYVQNSTTIARYRVRDAMITTAASFTNLSDMCSITFSPSRNRWYFHHEGMSQFGGSDESIGYCDGRFENP